MLVVCAITVVVMNSGIGWVSQANVEGKVLASNEHRYLIDFSKQAKEKGYEGNYDKVIVDKEKCVEEK
jgi:hypothetical protein